MFESEKEMQSWLSNQLKIEDSIHSLIIEPDWNINSFNYQEAKIFESYKYCLTNLIESSVVCEDMDISQRENECLRPDFLIYSNGYETFAIVELKNISNPTRQTATELAAYANALKSYFPRISDGDIFYVVVSNEWPALLMNYLFHDIYYLNRKVLCLKPRCHDNNILLECINPRQFRDQIDKDTITEDRFNGYQVCLYGNNVYRGGDVSELENNIEQIRSAFLRMNNRAELINSHGFGFLWRDYGVGTTVAPYSITIVDINPYAKSLYEDEANKGIHHELQSMLDYDEASGHTYSIHHIIDAGTLFLDSICNVRLEGSLNWDHLKEYMLEDSKLIEFRCWGFVAEKYELQLAKSYANGEVTKNYNDPDLGLDFVETKLFE